MQLSRKAIDDFKKIYFEEIKVKLTDEEANKKGVDLLEFIKLIYKPIPKLNDNENATNQRNNQE